MKRLIALLMAATMMVSLAACSSEEGSGDKDTAGGENEDGTRTVVVGTNGSGEPYSLVADDGTWTGVEAELWAEVGERTGWEIEVKQVGRSFSVWRTGYRPCGCGGQLLCHHRSAPRKLSGFAAHLWRRPGGHCPAGQRV